MARRPEPCRTWCPAGWRCSWRSIPPSSLAGLCLQVNPLRAHRVQLAPCQVVILQPRVLRTRASFCRGNTRLLGGLIAHKAQSSAEHRERRFVEGLGAVR